MIPMKRTEFDGLACQVAAILGGRFDSPQARAMLWAIGRQESRMFYRRQIGGPARGLWQFERGGGVRGVLTHGASEKHAETLCTARGVVPVASVVYHALEADDVLAMGLARLLLYTDPDPLPMPMLGNEQAAWRLYLKCWRPGRPHPDTFPAFWAEACEIAR